MAMQTAQLAELLRAADSVVEVVPNNCPYRPAWVARWPGFRALFRLMPYFLALWRMAGRSDLIHLMANSGWSWHLFAVPAIWIGWLRRVPVVVNYRGGEASGFLASCAGLVRFSMRRASKLVVPSGYLQEIFAEYGMSSDILPNVVDLTRFRPSDAWPPPDPVLLVARNLEPLYDNASALRAFARVRERWPKAMLIIAGTGPQANELRDLADELGLAGTVSFVGRLDRDAMAALLRGASVALNPSLADNMPNSVLEALASGIPVVSTAVGGVPYMVENGRTALLVPPRDDKAMGDAVMRLLADGALARRLAAAGLQSVRGNAWDQVAPKLAALYRSVLGSRLQGAANPI
ncbi:MAG: glycosyltransferase [Burkholderiaceae bacterium]|nr:glycosyltransferase [Burkholderiaceae bacterium]